MPKCLLKDPEITTKRHKSKHDHFEYFGYFYDTFDQKSLPDVFEYTDCIRAVFGQKVEIRRQGMSSLIVSRPGRLCLVYSDVCLHF